MPKILIIDDDPGVIRVLRRVLELEGYTVSEARDGREGLRCMERDPADLVISDVYMPDMDGIDFGQEGKTVFYFTLPLQRGD